MTYLKRYCVLLLIGMVGISLIVADYYLPAVFRSSMWVLLLGIGLTACFCELRHLQTKILSPIINTVREQTTKVSFLGIKPGEDVFPEYLARKDVLEQSVKDAEHPGREPLSLLKRMAFCDQLELEKETLTEKNEELSIDNRSLRRRNQDLTHQNETLTEENGKLQIEHRLQLYQSNVDQTAVVPGATPPATPKLPVVHATTLPAAPKRQRALLLAQSPEDKLLAATVRAEIERLDLPPLMGRCGYHVICGCDEEQEVRVILHFTLVTGGPAYTLIVCATCRKPLEDGHNFARQNLLQKGVSESFQKKIENKCKRELEASKEELIASPAVGSRIEPRQG